MSTYSYPGFIGEKCHCTLCSVCVLTHMCSGLIGISTRTFGRYLCVFDGCFGIAGHVGDVHTLWVEFLDSQIESVALNCLLSIWKISEVLRICLNIIS